MAVLPAHDILKELLVENELTGFVYVCNFDETAQIRSRVYRCKVAQELAGNKHGSWG